MSHGGSVSAREAREIMVGLGSRQTAAHRGEGRYLFRDERLTPGDLGLVLGPEPAEWGTTRWAHLESATRRWGGGGEGI